MEENKIAGHKEKATRATRQILLEVLQILENFHESLILAGGWVPIMIIPDAEDKHVGTLDVDLIINDRTLDETGSNTIEDILLANDYQQGAEPGRYFKTINVDGQSIRVPVDFLTSDQRSIPKNEFFDITGINAINSPGCELCFDINEKVKLSGKLPDGSSYSTEIKSAGIAEFIVMKAHAMSIRSKSKDAYDIWFCLANYPDTIDNIAKSFEPHLEKNSMGVALALLAMYFGSIDDRGPKDVVKEDGAIDPEYRAFLRQDSFQRVQALLKCLDVE